ncbi:MAG: aminotransferase DegT [Omnitrophica bacterium RIFOXYB12_FULL_50_7]|nr:MAG: aminotransferase DegT [Omnitrophica bacterium RIFOXYB12_FULL_50_7]
MQHVNSKLDKAAILKAIRSCLPAEQKNVELHEPYLCGNEWNYVKECLDTNWVSSVGKFVDVFEQKLAEYTGVKRAFAVVNGTAALHISLKMAGVDEGNEVLVPDLTFVATANAVTYCGAIPHFVDCDEMTLGVDPKALSDYLSRIAEIRDGECINRETGRKIKVLVAMHTFGHPCDLEKLSDLCKKYNLILIEDAAEALGSFYKNRHVGHWGKFSILSFNGNKTITTGGGGAILTNDEKLGVRAKHIATTAKLPHPFIFFHDQIGYNYRMPNINAALGVAQLENLPRFLERKRVLAMRYKKSFQDVAGVRFVDEPGFSKSNFWLNAILLDADTAAERDGLLEYLRADGIKARPAWTLMHKLPMFQDCPRMEIPMAEAMDSRLINIPSSAFL